MKNKTQSKFKKRLLLYSLLTVALLIASFRLLKTYSSKKETEIRDTYVEKEENQKAESELEKKLEEVYSEEHEDIAAAVEETAEGSDNYGIYCEDLTTGDVVAYNEDKQFVAGSTTKVVYVMNLADWIAAGELRPDDTLVYMASSDYEEGTGILQYSDELYSPIRLDRLMELAITESDNIAKNMIKRISPNIEKYIYDITGAYRNREGNYISAEQQGKILKALYSNANENPIYDTIIDNMKNTSFHDRIDKYIPQDIVAHKIGNYGQYTHDTGIIYTERPYSLSVYTEYVDSEVIAELSLEIYNIKVSNDSKIYYLKEEYGNAAKDENEQ